MATITRSDVTANGTDTVTPRRVVLALGSIVAVLAAVAAAVGLFASGGPGTAAAMSVRGQATDLYGVGLYRLDSVLLGVGNRGTDAVTLFLEVPALVLALWLYRRRSVRGTVALIGVLGWMLYYYASMSLSTAFNRLFPVYVAVFAAALFAVPLAFASVDAARFAREFPARPSRKLLVGYLGALAAALTLAWAPAMIDALLTGAVPARLGLSSTEVTWAIDLGVVVPAVAGTAVLLHRGDAVGPLAATALLSLNVALGLALAGQGVAQLLAGVPMTPGERVGAMASFGIMTAVAGALLVTILRGSGRSASTMLPSSSQAEPCSCCHTCDRTISTVAASSINESMVTAPDPASHACR
jgi:hypothetical protein